MGKGTADRKYLTDFEKEVMDFLKDLVADINDEFLTSDIKEQIKNKKEEKKELKKQYDLRKARKEEKEKIRKQREEKEKEIKNGIEELKENLRECEKLFKFWTKIFYNRDAGVGVGAGKLQRDNIHTRGQGGKNLLSNRNFRWTPLVIAKELPPWANEIDGIKYSNEEKLFQFKINGRYLNPGKEIYDLPLNERPFCITEGVFMDFWKSLDEETKKNIKSLSPSDWTRNACIIPAAEYTYWNWAVESFILLLISAVYTLQNCLLEEGKIDELYNYVKNKWEVFLKDNENNIIPEANKTLLPKEIKELILCPLCKVKLTDFPAGLEPIERPDNWSVSSFPWNISKQKEGNKESIQLLHINPLIEKEIRHTPKNVRYGHRWCNIAMADTSLEDTLKFFQKVIENQQG